MNWVYKSLLLLALFLVGNAVYLLYFVVSPEPDLPGALAERGVVWDGYPRTYSFYKPSNLADNPSLIFVFHGSGGDVTQSRVVFGYAFEQLAEQYGFVVVYPDGYEQHYNGCRKAGPYDANTLNIDDVGYMRSLVEIFVKQLSVNRKTVFATGLSNGGQMALRLALEAPDLVAAVAPIATSMPSEENMDCTATGKPVAFLLMNGTDDPMNPYLGGTVALYGLYGDRGKVLSSRDSVDYWADLAGHTEQPEEIALHDKVVEDNSTVVIHQWQAPGRKSVALYTIVGGGHNAPHPKMQFPKLLGGTNNDIVAADEIWAFFQESIQ
jgi:polyhydroxybutyrate depolymerase